MGASLSRRRSPSKSPAQHRLSQFLHKKEAHQLLSKTQSSSPLIFLLQASEEGLNKKKQQEQKRKWMPFSHGFLVSKDKDTKIPDHLLQLQLHGIHNIGPRAYIETVLEGTKVQLEELRLTLLHTFANSRQVEKRKIWKDGQITIFAGTNFNLRHRLSLESVLGSEEHGLTFATILSTDFVSGMSWGFANSYRPYSKLTFFSRFTSDDHSGKRMILQAVQKLNDKNTLSPIFSATLGGQSQAGISWTHQFNSGAEDNIQVKALCNKEGAFSVNVKTQVGEV